MNMKTKTKKIVLLSLFLMSSGCTQHDPSKCPTIKLINNPLLSEIYASQISCGFQKMCLVKYDGATNTKTCKEHD